MVIDALWLFQILVAAFFSGHAFAVRYYFFCLIFAAYAGAIGVGAFLL